MKDMPKNPKNLNINYDNNQVIKLNNLEIQSACEKNIGGYFNVQTYQAILETNVADSTI